MQGIVGANVSKHHACVLVCICACMPTCVYQSGQVLRMAEDYICYGEPGKYIYGETLYK